MGDDRKENAREVSDWGITVFEYNCYLCNIYFFSRKHFIPHLFNVGRFCLEYNYLNENSKQLLKFNHTA